MDTLKIRLGLSFPHWKKLMVDQAAIERLLNYLIETSGPSETCH